MCVCVCACVCVCVCVCARVCVYLLSPRHKSSVDILLAYAYMSDQFGRMWVSYDISGSLLTSHGSLLTFLVSKEGYLLTSAGLF